MTLGANVHGYDARCDRAKSFHRHYVSEGPHGGGQLLERVWGEVTRATAHGHDYVRGYENVLPVRGISNTS